ncbi:MAG: Gfo/Idh/MocA family oxidoreductase [Hydrococcus sp. CSU_1_8]|nr:Gfo/Idh/MocA family oxidoreductase [Hydrococcus sp. CSU_1_8]
MKIAIVGFGFIAQKGHLPTYQSRDDLNLRAVVDPVSARREEALKLHPGIRVYETLSDLLEDCPQEIDLVDICAPNVFHIPAARQALAAGKHVLCEKPLALNLAEFEDIKQLALEKRRLLYPCHNYKFAPSVVHAAKLVRSGAIGEPLYASFQVYRVSHARGVPEWQPHWRRDKAIAGGGIAIDHGVHAISIAHSLLGGAPKQVAAHIRNLGNDKDTNLTENTALICLDWESVLVQINLTWVGSVRKSSFRVQGTEGEICIDNDDVIFDRQKIKNVTPCIVPTDFDDPSHSSWFSAVINDIQHHIATENYEPASLIEAGRVAEIMEKAHQSSTQGGGWLSLKL